MGLLDPFVGMVIRPGGKRGRYNPGKIIYISAGCSDLRERIPQHKYKSPQSLPTESLVTVGVRDGKPSRSGKRPRLRNESQRASSAPPQELATVENGAGERVGPA